MRLLQGVLLLILFLCAAAAYRQSFTRASQQHKAPTPSPSPSTTPTQANPNQEINNRFVRQIQMKIAGRENEPAVKVFRNIQVEWLKNIPARRLLLIMNAGYSRALGVNCTHCHSEEDFASDDKRPKRAAREMAVMHKMINEQLAKMQNLEKKPEERFINCSTCHRGAIDPTAADR